MKCVCEELNMDVIGFLLDIGFKVHPIDEEKFIYGVYSSESKVYDRFLQVLEKYPLAELTDSDNLCKGDYIIYLEGGIPITTLGDLYNGIKSILNVEEYDHEDMIHEIIDLLKNVEGV